MYPWNRLGGSRPVNREICDQTLARRCLRPGCSVSLCILISTEPQSAASLNRILVKDPGSENLTQRQEDSRFKDSREGDRGQRRTGFFEDRSRRGEEAD